MEIVKYINMKVFEFKNIAVIIIGKTQVTICAWIVGDAPWQGATNFVHMMKEKESYMGVLESHITSNSTVCSISFLG